MINHIKIIKTVVLLIILTLSVPMMPFVTQTVALSNNQVTVSGVISQMLTFSLSTNATDFTTLNASNVLTSSPVTTMNIASNAAGGYTINVQDQGDGTSPGLYSASSGKVIASSTKTLSAGTEGYGIQCAVTGTGNAVSPYNVTGNNVGGLSCTTASPMASSTGPVDNDALTVTYKAAISNSTPAGSYVDTITYVAAGSF